MNISEVGKNMLSFQEDLAREYGYKPIQPNLFLGDVRDIFRRNLPVWCSETGDENCRLQSPAGTVIASGYKRIVIGDYGAFLEIEPSQIFKDRIYIKPGEEYRREERYSCKYEWYIPRDHSNTKIYYQLRPVTYADYLPGMYYISPYEVFPD